MNDPDPRTLARAREGDLAAFEDLVRQYQGDVWRFAYHFTRDRSLADDVTQDAFLRAFRFLRGFRGDSKFTSWLFRIARNCAMDQIKARNVYVERVTPIISELRSVFLEDNALRRGKIIMGVSEAILASWGPRLFAEIRDEVPGVEFSFHAQRSPPGILTSTSTGAACVPRPTCSRRSPCDMKLLPERTSRTKRRPAAVTVTFAPMASRLPAGAVTCNEIQ